MTRLVLFVEPWMVVGAVWAAVASLFAWMVGAAFGGPGGDRAAAAPPPYAWGDDDDRALAHAAEQFWAERSGWGA